MHYDDFQDARNLLENASELLPDDSSIKLLLARASLEAREPAEVDAVLRTVPAKAGSPGEVEYLRGSALLLVGKIEAASQPFSSALAADPKNVEYLIGQAWLDQIQGHFEQAGASLKPL